MFSVFYDGGRSVTKSVARCDHVYFHLETGEAGEDESVKIYEHLGDQYLTWRSWWVW